MLKKILILLFIIASLQNNIVRSEESEALETKVKAAYLYNFLRFVQWPENVKLESNICVFGVKESYRSAFSSMVAISKKTKKIKIDFFKSDEEVNKLSTCQILFITEKASNKSIALIEYLKSNEGHHILTVGESEEFINNGGMINFIRIKDKIRFEINQDAANNAGLKISSQVLRIAERVINKAKNT